MFPPQHRLRRRPTKGQGRLISGQYLGLLVHSAQPNTPTKLAILVSAKTERRATDRNRIKRRLREGLRPYLPHLKEGYEVVVLARASARVVSPQELRADLQSTLRRAQLINEDKGT